MSLSLDTITTSRPGPRRGMKCSDHVIGLVARERKDRNPHCLQDAPHVRNLLPKIVGISVRFALYSVYSCSRNVFPALSKMAAI